MPDCVTTAYGYNPEPNRSYIDQDEGVSCPFYDKRDGPPKELE